MKVGWKSFFRFSFVFILFLSSCSTEQGSSTENSKSYGGSFSYCESNRIQSIHPPLVSDESSKRVASQVFEGLVQLNPVDLEIEPCIAESFDFDPENFIYTFKLKKNVRFHDDKCFEGGKGRLVKADDVIFTFNQICTKQLINSAYFNALKGVVKGADEFFKGEADKISGINAPDQNTITIQLNKPNSSFLKKIAGVNFSIIAKEAVQKYGAKNKVGTGAFIPQQFDSYNDRYVLTKNPSYHGTDEFGNSLPFMDSVLIYFDHGLKHQMEGVVNKKYSTVLNLPVKAVKRILRTHNDKFDNEIKMQNSPLLSTYFIEFNLKSPKLQNKNFRKAISYAINKRILTEIIFGETRGKVGDVGITHPSMTEYRTGRIKGYTFNPDSARACLEKAGMMPGDSSLTLDLEIGENDHKSLSIADELRLQLEQTIGVELKINVVPERYKLEKTRYARGDIAISQVVANYASPEGFLRLFYGKGVPKTIDIPSYPNTTRFTNRAFDKMMDRGRRSVDQENAYRSFASAERLLMEEAPIVVLWYEEVNRLVDARLQNFPLNKLLYMDLSRVSIKAN